MGQTASHGAKHALCFPRISSLNFYSTSKHPTAGCYKGYCSRVGRGAECGLAEQDAVLAGDPKMFRLLCNTNLNMIHT